MKRIMLMFVAILALSCNAQETKKKPAKEQDTSAEEPKGSWKVNREYDEAGNLIRYDSIYSWSSDDRYNDLSALDQDSLLQSLQSRFNKHFSGFDQYDFQSLFPKDSLFMDRFFNEDFFDSEFGKDFMDLDHIRKRMESMQKQFMERYKSEFNIPEEQEN